MRKSLCSVFLAGAMTLSSFSIVKADDYLNGVTAFEQGDHALALSFWLPLAENGHGKAQYSLGKLYETPEYGSEPKYVEAIKWYEAAANQGVAAAQNNLGRLYAQGKGVDVDRAKAVGYWRMASESNHPMAQYNLGLALFRGEGVPQNFERAVFWFHQSANNNVSGAQYALGEVYRLGLSVPVDHKQAEKWYRAAEKNGNKSASGRLVELARLDTEPEMKQAVAGNLPPEEPDASFALKEESDDRPGGSKEKSEVKVEAEVEVIVPKPEPKPDLEPEPIETASATSIDLIGPLKDDRTFRPKKNPRGYAGVGSLLVPKPKSNPRR
ncbi:tetratricopeptide repeat protein [Kiloniella litopenaei]|uniref:tetratricopeptide repeat protein n=1 Tax=Kiloniella litopenaei TaxID=1549748 RepID=UPI0006969E53|nr:tetratricopeptide repeat protein [Kiloniella litopenaei]